MPTEFDDLLGDFSKAKKILNWETEKKLSDLVKEMVQYDLRNI